MTDVRLAQLDRAFGYGPKGRGFESSNARFPNPKALISRFSDFLLSFFLQKTGRIGLSSFSACLLFMSKIGQPLHSCQILIFQADDTGSIFWNDKASF